MSKAFQLEIKDIVYRWSPLFILFIILFPSLFPLPIFAPWLIMLIGLMVGMTLISFIKLEEERGFLCKIFIYSYLLRILIALLLHLISYDWDRHYGFFIGDGWGYSDNGWYDVCGRLERGLSIKSNVIKRMSISGAIHSYDYINGMVYYFLGGLSPLSMLFLNCAIGAITIIFTYYITTSLFERREISRIAILLCAFWPSLILWSTQNLKEPLTIFLVVLCFWGVVSFLKRFNPLYLIVIVGSIFSLMKFRDFVATFILISLFLHIVFLLCMLAKRIPLLLLILIPLFILGYIESRRVINIDFFRITNLGISGILEEIDYERRVRAIARLAILPNFKITSIGTLLFYIPIGLFAILFGPFPWQLFSPAQVFALPETLVWYFLFPFFIRGIFFTIKNNSKYAFSIFIFSISILLILAIVEGNIGTMFRHKAIVMEFFLIFISVGVVVSNKFKSFLGVPLKLNENQ